MMRKLVLSMTGVVLALGLLLVYFAAPAAAMENRSGQSVTVAQGETVQDDLYAGGGTVEVAGTVDGNVIAGGGTVTISGEVTHDVMVAAGQVDITGTVRGSVRAISGNLRISGTVMGDVVAAGGSITTTPDAVIGRDLAVAAGNATIDGQVARDAYLGGGNVTLDGRVGGNLKADVNTLTIGSAATVAGNITYSASQAANINSGAQVQGGVQRTAQPSSAPNSPAGQALGAVQGLVGFVVFGLIILLLFPGFSRSADPTLARQPWVSLGIGVALVFGVPFIGITAFILGLIVGGWWISLLLLGLYIAALVAGAALSAEVIGRWTFHLLRARIASPLLFFLVGALILWVVGLIPLLGGLVNFVAAIFGVGALTVAVWNARFGGGGRVAAQAPSPAPPAPQYPAPMPTG